MGVRYVKRENWNHQYVYVVRFNGRIDTWKKVKGSKQSLSTVDDIYQKNKTLYEDRKKSINKALGTKPIITVTSTTGNLPKSKKGWAFVVEGDYTKEENGKRKTYHIVGRSHKLGTPLAKTRKQAEDFAYDIFYERLSAIENETDKDEGKRLFENVRNKRSGWVYYGKNI